VLGEKDLRTSARHDSNIVGFVGLLGLLMNTDLYDKNDKRLWPEVRNS
jgi:hypothetical protein